MHEDYFLGLDIGTGSVGWAVTNNRYEILKSHGKALWGVRLFETAKTAEERRTFRAARRRLSRRNERLKLLQSIFEESINHVDDGFYFRMKESRFTFEDKKDKEGNQPELPYALFVDKNYTDKDYHKQFPTIYHLRKWLMKTSETPDIRLVYLALHHMMKHRGHFLFSGNLDTIKDFRGIFEQFIETVKNEDLDFNIELTDEKLDTIEQQLKDKSVTKSTKATILNKELIAKTSCEKAIFKLIVGSSVKLSDIFTDKELDNCEKPKVCFSDANYEEYATTIEADLGEKFLIISQAKAIYDWSILVEILGEHKSISDAKVAVYEKHKQDLSILKKVVKENCTKQTYENIFVKMDEKTSNYCSYIGMSKRNGKKLENTSKSCTKFYFYSFLKKTVLEKNKENADCQYILSEIDKETFLPKQVISDNGVLPHQVHLYELNQIINNLKDKIEVLKDNEEKIRSIFTFRIPYYIGPLNGITKNGKRTNWVVRNSNDKIYPWNFEDVVDIHASAQQFITRMTNKCTYLVNEDVLPKYSLLYSKFTVLNELNNLRINGEKISVELKQQIYEELFQKTRKVTQKKLKTYLSHHGFDKSIELTGIDGDFKGSLTAYHDFKEKLTDVKLSQKEKENIIFNITIFGEDEKLLKSRLKKLYPELTDKQISSISALSYSGWGRLSRKFLEEIEASEMETSEMRSIIQVLWETNDNLMQILSDKYDFIKVIEKENASVKTKELTYSVVDELYVSPSVKRQIWQTLQIIKELCKVMGKPPKRVFVEVAKGHEEKIRKESRKNKLIELYKKCKDEERQWVDEINATDESVMRSDKLFLYYTQKGRCMYSGDPIDLDELWDNKKYDIDHIYPQSLVMDDSLDNRVLVKKQLNASKSDNYPIAHDIRENMHSYWKMLLDCDLISKEKYKRLTRCDELDANELAGFIARQLVETRQSTKAVCAILKQVLPETEVVYSKSRIASKFRQDFDFIKVREMNDLHHAKDAYINIVIGNTYHLKFTKSPMNFIKNNPKRSYNLEKMFTGKYDVERNGEVAWVAGDEGTIVTVKKFMAKNNILVTRRAYEVKGGLFDQQLMKKGKGQVPVKGTDHRLSSIEKYGGYNKATGSYFVLVESLDKKGHPIRTIEYIPLHLAPNLERSEDRLIEYLTSPERGLKEPKILLNKIKRDTLFKLDGFYMWLSGRTENRLLFKGANQLILNENETKTLKKIIKFENRKKDNKEAKIYTSDNLYENDLISLYDALFDKLCNSIYGTRLSAQIKTFEKGKDTFEKLTIEEKCSVLSEALHLFQCNSVAANLKLIGGPASSGILVLNSDITTCKQISIINQSITGIYEQEIDLKRI